MKKTKNIIIRVTDDQHEFIKSKAEKAGMTMTDFIIAATAQAVIRKGKSK